MCCRKVESRSRVVVQSCTCTCIVSAVVALSLWIQSCSPQSIVVPVFNGEGRNYTQVPAKAISPETHIIILSDNSITLAADVFSSIPQSTSLDLSNNQITVVPDFAFRGLINLTKLLLKENEISYLENNAFLGLNKMNYLDLSRNIIEKVTGEILAL